MQDEQHVGRTIEMVQGQIRDLERDLVEKKRMVNSLCKLVGREPIFTSVEPAHAGTVLRSDEFYGKALTSAARTVLERRDAAGLGAASVEVLYADLLRGGFQFDAKNDGTAKRSLAISLAKNSYLFHRLPNGDWGLVTWYEKIPVKTKGNGSKDQKDEVQEDETDDLGQSYANDFAGPEVAQEAPSAPAAPPEPSPPATAAEIASPKRKRKQEVVEKAAE